MLMKEKIFIVEDDRALQELYRYSLEDEFECFCFDDGSLLFNEIKNNKPDLVILDIMLPGDDGFAILMRMKSKNSTAHIPVIMVSAKGEEILKVKGLNMGADDYIAKPFGVLELVARIKANIRKNRKPHSNNIEYKDITIDATRHQIRVQEKQLKTTLKEYNLLCLLCEHAEAVQTRETLFKEVWGEDFFGETRTLDVHIKELRRKLTDAESCVSIQTIRGVGYLVV